jgi:hypothetical protein
MRWEDAAPCATPVTQTAKPATAGPLSTQQAISTYPDASRVSEDYHADGQAEILSLEPARVLAPVAGKFMKLLWGTDP